MSEANFHTHSEPRAKLQFCIVISIVRQRIVKTRFAATNKLGGIKALPGINRRFRENGFVKHSNGTFGGGDLY
jgi:hypothetical protein